MTRETFVAVHTDEALWLLPERGLLDGGERSLVERLGRLDRVLLASLTADRKRKA